MGNAKKEVTERLDGGVGPSAEVIDPCELEAENSPPPNGSDIGDSTDSDEDGSEVELLLPSRFVGVVDDETLCWFVRRHNELVALRRASKEQWAKLARRVDRDLETLLFRFGAQAEALVQQKLSQSRTRRKSLILPTGTVGFRTAPERLTVDDETKALAWAKQSCPTAVVTVERLLKSALDEHFKQSGEEPTGTHVEAACEKFYIR